MTLAIATFALIVERLFGYPQALQTRIGHPVQWMGALIAWLDRRLNREERRAEERRLSGVLALLILLTASGLSALLAVFLLRLVPFGWMGEALIASSLLAQKQLGRMVADVAAALKRSVQEGREAVSHIVGRDTNELEEPDIARAAIETLAENASDGVVAPLFWLLLLGLPGIVLYKAVNTADSMIGHKNRRYEDFGWAAAKLDDGLNFIPARLTALLVAAASWVLPGANASQAWETARNDAPDHASPNAGWPEAALAGALGFGLGGPRSYRGKWLDLPLMGHGRRDLGPADIRLALRLYEVVLTILLVATAGAALLLVR